MLENLHLIRPLWLLALLPLALLAWRVIASRGHDNGWRNVVDARLLPLLQVGQPGKANHQALWLLATGWLIATLALADPTWERRPLPVFQTSAARVVVLDLSDSMNAVDLKPSRLVRARYKVEDVLAQATERQTGLVAYAGDAFTVSPLTRDANTVRSLLKVLEPDLMPTQGARADLGLAKAGDLLRQAGLTSGQVLLIADAIDSGHASATDRAAAKLRSEGYTVSVLGIGTEAGAPLPGVRGALARDASGSVVVSRLDTTSLRSVARAGGGDYRTISEDGGALRALLAAGPSAQPVESAPADMTASAWKERGPVLVLFLLPLAALAFRRNWLVGLTLAAALAAPAQSAEAATWTDAWQRPDQQAAHAMGAGDYAKAAKAAAAAADPKLQGSAAYKLGDYQLALDDFSRAAGADADYNRGNALARLNRYQEAIAAYDKSLAQRPGDDDAQANKAAVEALLKREQQQQQQGQGANSSKGGSAQQQQGKDQTQNRSQSQSQSQSQGQGGNSASRGGQHGQTQGSQGQQGAGPANASASPSRKDESASAKGNQAEQSSPPAGQSGQQSASNAQSPSAQAASNQFAQAVKRLGSTDQNEKASADQTATGTPRAGQAVRGDESPDGHYAASAAATGHAQPLESEERLAAEQWLRRIPDDPGGLLRRKFLYQYRQRQQPGDADDQ